MDRQRGVKHADTLAGNLCQNADIVTRCRRCHGTATTCTSILPFARGCRVGVWFGFVRAALLPAVGTCVVLAFGAMPGRCCFLRVTPTPCRGVVSKQLYRYTVPFATVVRMWLS